MMAIDQRIEAHCRLIVVEMMVAMAFARLFGDEAEMRSWTNRTAEQARRHAEARTDEAPEISMAYIAAWDAMLANVRHYHASLRDDGHAGGDQAG